MTENNLEKKSNTNSIIFFVIFLIIIIVIFLFVTYIKDNSNKINKFQNENKINTKELLLEQIKKNKEKINNNLESIDNETTFLNKTFFEEIRQSNVINSIKNNVDQMQFYLKKYKEEDVKHINEKLDMITDLVKNNSIQNMNRENSIEIEEIKNEEEKKENEFEKIDT